MNQRSPLVNEHAESLLFERETFLRNKMYELHLFIVKLIVTFSSSALVFSIGMLSLLKEDQTPVFELTLLLGWFFIILSIIFIMIGLFIGLSLTYDYFNNIASQQNEINSNTNKKETLIHCLVILSSVTSGIGVVFILVFAFLNFL